MPVKWKLTLSLLLATQEAFVDGVDQDQTAQNVHCFILDNNLTLKVPFTTIVGFVASVRSKIRLHKMCSLIFDLHCTL